MSSLGGWLVTVFSLLSIVIAVAGAPEVAEIASPKFAPGLACQICTVEVTSNVTYSPLCATAAGAPITDPMDG
jgi:hypothetical protein